MSQLYKSAKSKYYQHDILEEYSNQDFFYEKKQQINLLSA